jgi:AcrR family transcriptional regulator
MIDEENCCTAPARRSDVRRRKLIEAARNLFILNGFHATGIAQIADQSGVAVGQIYRDFSSKEDIVAAIVREDCARYTDSARLEAAVEVADSDAALLWLLHFVEPGDDLDGDRMFAEIVAESSRNERIAAIFVTLQADLRGRLLEALSLLAPGEAIADNRGVLADAIMTFSLGLLQHRLFRPDLRVDPLVDNLRRMITEEVEKLKFGGRTED